MNSLLLAMMIGVGADSPLTLADFKMVGAVKAARPTYVEARALSLREQRHFIIWVDYSCPPCERELSGCVHHHEPGPLFGLKGPAVIVGRYANGELYRTDLTDDLSTRAILATLQPPTRLWMPAVAPPPPFCVGNT